MRPPAAHFTPWQSAPRPCSHCSAFDGYTAAGSAALCSRPGCCRVRSTPANGCSAFEREPGVDDEEPAGADQNIGRRAPVLARGPGTAARPT